MGTIGIIRDVLSTKSGKAASVILGALVLVAIILPFFVTFEEAKQWTTRVRWLENPRLAQPEWVDLFTDRKMSRNLFVGDEDFMKISEELPEAGKRKLTLETHLDYQYDDFPTELKLYLIPELRKARRMVTMTWIKPGGEEIELYRGVLRKEQDIFYTPELKENIHEYASKHFEDSPQTVKPEVILFVKEGENLTRVSSSTALKGEYRIKILADLWDEGDNLSANFRAYGEVYGLAGTDSTRRDLALGLLWGTPIALAFGLIASIFIAMIQVILGAAGALYGGRVDTFVQRAAEFFMILPGLVVLILVCYFYEFGIMQILFTLIIISIVGPISKVARGVVLQAREEQYVEAARSYGASRLRILFKHMVPRVLPYTYALMALGVPIYIFIESALSFLGLGDPRLPTWGRILGDAFHGGAGYHGFWWWICAPIVLLVITATAFALLGYSLDRVVTPRLREVR